MAQATYIGNSRKTLLTLTATRELIAKYQFDNEQKLKRFRTRLAKRLLNLRTRIANNTKRRLNNDFLKIVDNQISEINKSKTTILQNAQSDALELILEIAREVIGSEVLLNKTTLQARVERALNSLLNNSSAKIKINSLDKDGIASSFTQKFKIDFDETIPQGNCLIETDAGILKVDWCEHFSAISSKLHNILTTKM